MSADTIAVSCSCAKCPCRYAAEKCRTCIDCGECNGAGSVEVPPAEVFDAPALWDRVAVSELLELLSWSEERAEDPVAVRALEGAIVVRGGLVRAPRGGFLVGGVTYAHPRLAWQAMQTRRVA